MEVTVNGEVMKVPENSTLSEVIRRLGLNGAAFATEVNRQLVPREAYDSTRLAPGDLIEIVTLVGGG